LLVWVLKRNPTYMFRAACAECSHHLDRSEQFVPTAPSDVKNQSDRSDCSLLCITHMQCSHVTLI